MNLLVKNLKPNDKTQELPHWNRKRRLKEMYEQQPHASSPMFSPSSLLFGGTSAAGNEAALKEHIADAFGSVKSEDTCMLQAHEIKKEVEEIKDKDGHDNLFTSAGLQVTCEIPDQIFDNSDDNSTDDAVRCLIFIPLHCPYLNYSFSCKSRRHQDPTNQAAVVWRNLKNPFVRIILVWVSYDQKNYLTCFQRHQVMNIIRTLAHAVEG